MIWDVNPILLSLGPLTVRWYGLFFVIGFMLGFQGMKRIFVRDGFPIERLDSLLIHLMLGTIIGARLGHCFFYEPEYFFAHPLEIVAVWKGGLASHGGFLGVFIAIWLFCRRSQMPFFYILDRVSVFSLFVGGLIRLGNLMNSEIIGRPSDVPWAFTFMRVDHQPRHPTQIYESLCYLFFSFVAWRLEQRYRRRLPAGFLFGFILFFGFISRFCVEFLKENQESFENGMSLNMGQMLSLIPIAIGALLLIRAWRSGLAPDPSLQTSNKSNKRKKEKGSL